MTMDERRALLARRPSLDNDQDSGRVVASFDQVLQHIGDIGPWQMKSVALLWPPSLAAGMIVLLFSFTALEPELFRCTLNQCDGPDATFYDVAISTFFAVDDQSRPDLCTKPALNLTANSLLSVLNCSQLVAESLLLDQHEMCEPGQRFLYAEFEFDRTITTDFNLVCGQKYKVALAGTLYMVGLLIGSFLGGPPADYFGRKRMLFTILALGGVANVAGALSTSFTQYTLFRTLCGIVEQGLTQVTFTLSVELVGTKYQSLVGNLNQVAFAMGTVVTGMLAYFIRDWRNLHFATASLILPQILLWWWTPESPRWLITKKKWPVLGALMRNCLRDNRAHLPADLLIPGLNSPLVAQPEGRSEERVRRIGDLSTISWKDMFVQSCLRSRSFIMMFNWGIVALSYYGIGMSMTLISGNIFLNFIAGAAAEACGYLFNVATSDHWGRKPNLVLGYLLAGMGCLSAGFLPTSGTHVDTARTVLLLLGKLGCSSAYAACYVYTAELFPTPIRNTAVGTCSMISGLVSLTAPYIALYLPDRTFAELPFLIFGSCCIVGTLLSMFLPESLGHSLPDTLEEAALMGGADGKHFFSWWSKDMLAAEAARNRQIVLGLAAKHQAHYF